MVTISEKELNNTILFLNAVRDEKRAHGLNTPNLDSNIAYLENELEEQRMMTSEETDEMVEWALKNVK